MIECSGRNIISLYILMACKPFGSVWLYIISITDGVIDTSNGPWDWRWLCRVLVWGRVVFPSLDRPGNAPLTPHWPLQHNYEPQAWRRLLMPITDMSSCTGLRSHSLMWATACQTHWAVETHIEKKNKSVYSVWLNDLNSVTVKIMFLVTFFVNFVLLQVDWQKAFYRWRINITVILYIINKSAA